jgi:peroxiredoxin Q/BCP
MKTFSSRLRLALLLATTLAGFVLARAAGIPAVGGTAPDFTLATLDGGKVRLGELNARGPVVLVFLRGWVGYNCPMCDRQVNEFITAATDFATAGARLVFIYPGPADALAAHAREFRDLKGRSWPADWTYALDQDYSVVNAYDLRWDAPKETAYPSTFVLGPGGKVLFAKVSRTHGGRATVAEVRAALP